MPGAGARRRRRCAGVCRGRAWCRSCRGPKRANLRSIRLSCRRRTARRMGLMPETARDLCSRARADIDHHPRRELAPPDPDRRRPAARARAPPAARLPDQGRPALRVARGRHGRGRSGARRARPPPGRPAGGDRRRRERHGRDGRAARGGVAPDRSAVAGGVRPRGGRRRAGRVGGGGLLRLGRPVDDRGRAGRAGRAGVAHLPDRELLRLPGRDRRRRAGPAGRPPGRGLRGRARVPARRRRGASWSRTASRCTSRAATTWRRAWWSRRRG